MKNLFFIISMIFIINRINAEILKPFVDGQAFVVNKDAIFFQEPDTNSQGIKNVNYLDNIFILKMTNVQIGNSNETWYYVRAHMTINTRSTNLVTGWLKLTDLAGESDFKPINKIQEIVIDEGTIDGPGNSYYIYSNGTYQIKANNYSGIVDKTIWRGEVYQYKNILMLANYDDMFNFLAGIFYYKDGKLEGLYSTPNVLTNQNMFKRNIESSYDFKSGDSMLHINCIITKNDLKVFEGPPKNTNVVCVLNMGSKITILERREDGTNGKWDNNNNFWNNNFNDKNDYWAFINTGKVDQKGFKILGWIYNPIKTPVFYESNPIYTVTGNNVEIRSDPDMRLPVLIVLSKGAKVGLISIDDKAVNIPGKKGSHWAYIDTGLKDKDGKEIKGSVLDYYLKEEPQNINNTIDQNLRFSNTNLTYTLTGDNVNVRAEAATNGAVLVKLSKGAKVTLLKRSDIAFTVGGKKGFWAYIDTQVTNKDGENIKGWVFDYYLKEEGK